MKIFSRHARRLRRIAATCAILSSGIIIMVYLFKSRSLSIFDPKYTADGIVNPHPFDWVIVEKELCNTQWKDLEILAVVPTAPAHFEQRMHIRETWGSERFYSMTKTVVVFALGWPADETLQAAIEYESSIYHDIIQEEFLDTYRNLTYKSIMALKYAGEHCTQAKFLLKVDDDIFLNIFNLVDLLRQEIVEPRHVICHVWYNATVQRDRKSKWFTSKREYANNNYSPYCNGWTYVISNEIVRPMFEESLYTKFFWLEDWYITGRLVESLKINHTDISYMLGYEENRTLAYEQVLDGSSTIASFDNTTLRWFLWNSILEQKGIDLKSDYDDLYDLTSDSVQSNISALLSQQQLVPG